MTYFVVGVSLDEGVFAARWSFRRSRADTGQQRLDVLHISVPSRADEERVALGKLADISITDATSDEVQPKTSSRGSLREGESGVVK
ncbi:hypothetical protein ACVWWO_006401 [Bradyrhizobium sp. F1.13.1]